MSARTREPRGRRATFVKCEPNEMFITDFPFTAQPFPSSIGARFLIPSLNHAMNIDGSDIAKTMPTSPSGSQ